ncbi:MAG: hypothetical protein ACRDV4_06565, partial [Acidimicrobiales bacterium]
MKLDTVLWLTRASTGTASPNPQSQGPDPVLPDYGGACISSLYPALCSRNGSEAASWLPEPCIGARQVVLLVLDG